MSPSVGTTLKSSASTVGSPVAQRTRACSKRRLEPRELVIELRSGLRIAARKVDGRHHEARCRWRSAPVRCIHGDSRANRPAGQRSFLISASTFDLDVPTFLTAAFTAVWVTPCFCARYLT